MILRILIVTDVYPPLIGGVERQMQLLAHQLQQRGHSVSIATSWQPGLPAYEEERGVQIWRLKGIALRVPLTANKSKRRHHPPFPDPAMVWSLRRLITQFQPDVIHAYGWITYSCAVALVGKDIPLLLSVREYGYTCALRTMMRYGQQPCSGPNAVKCLDCAMRFYGKPKGMLAAAGVWSGQRLLRWKTRGVHSVSTYMQENVRRDLFGGQTQARDRARPPMREAVIPSFRDDAGANDDTDLQAYIDQLPKEPYILFVGALRLVKGLQPLFAAYQQLSAPPPLVLIGRVSADTPPEFPTNVTVLYDFPHRAVMAAWERALFGVAPSIWPEPFGSVIHEAMSKGKAVIGTTPGGQTDMIVADETGIVVPAHAVDALAAAMQCLIDDPGRRARLGQAGYARAQLFTADVVVPQFENLYRQLAHKPAEHLYDSESVSISSR